MNSWQNSDLFLLLKHFCSSKDTEVINLGSYRSSLNLNLHLSGSDFQADLFLKDLRGHVVGGVAGGHQHPVVGPQLLGESKVADSNSVWISRIVRIENI